MLLKPQSHTQHIIRQCIRIKVIWTMTQGFRLRKSTHKKQNSPNTGEQQD